MTTRDIHHYAKPILRYMQKRMWISCAGLSATLLFLLTLTLLRGSNMIGGAIILWSYVFIFSLAIVAYTLSPARQGLSLRHKKALKQYLIGYRLQLRGEMKNLTTKKEREDYGFQTISL